MNLNKNLIVCRKLRGCFKGNKTGITGIRATVERSEHPLVFEGITLRLFNERPGVRNCVRWIPEGALVAITLTSEAIEALRDGKGLYAARHYQILIKAEGGTPESLISDTNKYLIEKAAQLKSNAKAVREAAQQAEHE